jgi:hypothetical protein
MPCLLLGTVSLWQPP